MKWCIVSGGYVVKIMTFSTKLRLHLQSLCSVLAYVCIFSFLDVG